MFRRLLQKFYEKSSRNGWLNSIISKQRNAKSTLVPTEQSKGTAEQSVCHQEFAQNPDLLHKQSPNYASTWSLNQRPKIEAMTGPRFSQIDLSQQVNQFLNYAIFYREFSLHHHLPTSSSKACPLKFQKRKRFGVTVAKATKHQVIQKSISICKTNTRLFRVVIVEINFNIRAPKAHKIF